MKEPEDYLKEKQLYIDRFMQDVIKTEPGLAKTLIEAMRYTLLAKGKRIRPILCIAAAETLGKDGADIMPMAVALEMIHAYSLIHDDLPCMDDDDLRRGRPTNHKVYGEAVAVLSGDALLTEAFRLMSCMELYNKVSPGNILRAISTVAHMAGYQGMVAGQAVDILYEGKEADLPIVEFIHRHKTGAMIKGALMSGAILAGGNDNILKKFEQYGEKIGLAFQIVDDILDIIGETEVLGKEVGSDIKAKKLTYPEIIGLHASQDIAKVLISEAKALAREMGELDYFFIWIADYILRRVN